MSATLKNSYGKIAIDNKVIATIAAESAQETYGIVGLVAQNTKDGIFELLKFENKTKGVKVTVNGDIVDVDLVVMMEFGVRIAVVADNIIEKVKYNIEKNTHLKVNSVNVIVQGIRV
ncbi:Asp23/Gls24 family envelope stress response protein [Helcococcus ovis]|uniref:Asp23/Gls24 family envelope stress response protein n=1 Tax=Helcococcus ovis TaxID=72026 RepID=A0A4R9C342_9FIRM|nr:Asp23/Gls24 family envelope stress response protein [Helcococcus ovis]TFF64899.1 Asp23/Gls24 family envelope stress response protein [Helcococcus ovis]TFF67176.1 Asp23/Gls24 family envelope stress response protein [Helcococcus ovis]TFF67370.1 Asp23/Gls24 family envelope stress response protein [Helcococcus ovis]WNZ01883.1 Asp23/Gls24 family envelope stress response protein [Helcococcus ovis]